MSHYDKGKILQSYEDYDLKGKYLQEKKSENTK